MVDSKKNRIKQKKFKLSLIFIWTALQAQSGTQIRYRELVKMYVPVIGKIEMVTTTVVAHGMVHKEEESTVDRFVFRWMGNSEGSIIDLSNGYKIFYDKEDEEYWHTTFEDLVEERVNPGTSNRKSASFTMGSNDDDEDGEEPVVSRTDQGIETINGIFSRKWTTTIVSDEGKMIFEEWMAEDISVRKKAIKMQRDINEKISLPLLEEEFTGITNVMSSLDEFDLDPIPGTMIKMNMMAFEEDEDDPKMSMSFELLEIKEETFNPSDYYVPVDYEFVKKK